MLQIKTFENFSLILFSRTDFWIFYEDTTRYNEKLRGGAEFGSGYGGRCFDIGVYCKLKGV
jgi:hypothetical protein